MKKVKHVRRVQSSTPSVPNDTWVFLFLYPILALSVIHIGNDNSLKHLLTLPSYYSDIVVSITCVYLLGYYYRSLFKEIDDRFDWDEKLRRRIFTHIIYGVALPTIAIVVIEMIYLQFFLNIPIASSSVFYLELPLIAFFCTLINLLYIVMYFRNHNLKLSQLIAADRQMPKVDLKNNFVVNQGTQTLNIREADVAYFILLEKSTFLVTVNNNRYLYNHSLDQITSEVNPDKFFQLNRQVIASRNSITQFTPTSTRKFSISLQPALDQEVFVSKIKSADFLRWLKK